MEKKIKTTKESLLKENARLVSVIETWAKNDENTRRTLSELLDSYEWTQEYGWSNRSKKVILRDWLGIAFLIGELKADADYAMCIQARESLRQENQALIKELADLKNPPKQL